MVSQISADVPVCLRHWRSPRRPHRRMQQSNELCASNLVFRWLRCLVLKNRRSYRLAVSPMNQGREMSCAKSKFESVVNASLIPRHLFTHRCTFSAAGDLKLPASSSSDPACVLPSPSVISTQSLVHPCSLRDFVLTHTR